MCETLARPETRTRELAALQEAMREQRLKHGEVITWDESGELAVAEGLINLIPAWQFLSS